MKTIRTATVRNSATRLKRATQFGAVLGATLIVASSLQAQDARPNPSLPIAQAPATSLEVSHSEKEFLQFAAQANQTEIAMADIAQAKSQNTTVKDLAQMMRVDHQKNYDQLQGIAKNHDITLDGSLDLMNRHAVNHLEKTSDATFDKDYTKIMLKDHVKAIATFDKAAAHMSMADIRSYAQSTLPALRKHLRHSENAARAVGVDESTISSILKGLPNEEAGQAVTLNQN
jgi:putative membrane protein